MKCETFWRVLEKRKGKEKKKDKGNSDFGCGENIWCSFHEIYPFFIGKFVVLGPVEKIKLKAMKVQTSY